jgi:hypothetical protein
VGTAVGGIDIETNGNDEIDVTGVGIASTDITWVTSIHAQIAVVPS